MILIDLVYLNSPGGLTLGRYILNFLIQKENPDLYKLLIDKRNCIHFKNYKIKKVVVPKNELSRLLFYNKNATQFKSVLCFGNVPPPLKIKSKIFIYFHNEILLDSKNLGFSIIKQFFFRLKWIYIKSINSNYIWFVQTEHMKKLLESKLGIKNNAVLKFPIFNSKKKTLTSKRKNTFIYPTSEQPHKNNKRLINAFIKVAESTERLVHLSLTIEKMKVDLPKNLKLYFLGLVDQNKLINEYSISQFLIFPSSKESFGLPLIEGIQSNCHVIASNLDYVNELITPSYFFDPNDVQSITEVILLALSNKNHPNSTIKVRNKIDSIFRKLKNV